MLSGASANSWFRRVSNVLSVFQPPSTYAQVASIPKLLSDRQIKVNELLGPASLNYGEHMYYVLETNEVTVPCQANGDYAAKLLNRYGVFLGVSGDPVDGPFGTPAVPAIVPTFHEGRIAACMGSAEHSHEILYFHIEKDSTCRCSECNQVFKAIQPELIVTVLPLETVAAVHDDATAAWKSFHSQAGDVEEVKPHLVHEYLHKIVDVYDNAKVKINEHDLKKMEELGLVALSEAGIEDSDALWNKAAALGATDKTRFHSLARLAQINREPVDVARIVETLKTPFDSTAVDEKRASDETFKDVKMMAHSDREDLTEAFAPIKSMMLAFVEVYSGKMSTPSIPEQAELSTILKGMDEAGLRELINIDTANAAFEEMRGKSSEDIAKDMLEYTGATEFETKARQYASIIKAKGDHAGDAEADQVVKGINDLPHDEFILKYLPGLTPKGKELLLKICIKE